ncbi:neuropeptide S receptor-like [Gigantopelta aegis]|uniref:neuropeptide S receptor-like n=1 Tax=Gigantopelta aegis TaxID=1735272 RepID=UPI001B888FC8|nr:neuropeptide S receptor-like [Gigantopelta aegis]
MTQDVVTSLATNHSDTLYVTTVDSHVFGSGTSGGFSSGATSGLSLLGSSGNNDSSSSSNAEATAYHVWSSEVRERIAVVTFIMVCTILGNSTLMCVILCKRSSRIKRVNVFLVNLALGDLAVALITNTTEILFLAFDDWALGPAMCKISVYLQIVTFASATFLLTAMSIDRYQVIVKPLHSLAHRPKIFIKVSVAWIMAFVFALPQLAIFVQVEQGVKYDGTPKRFCVSRGYTAEWQRKLYFTFLTTYILLVPSCVMLFCYSKIIRVVWSLSAQDEIAPAHAPQYTGSRSYQMQKTNLSRMSVRRGHVTACKRRVVVMTLTVIAGFLVCMGPYFVVTLIRIYSDYKLKLHVAQVVSENILLTHSALNPLLYGIFTLRFKHFTSLLNCIKCGHRSIKSPKGKNHLLNRGGGGGGCQNYSGKGHVIQLQYNTNRNRFLGNDVNQSKSMNYREYHALKPIGKMASLDVVSNDALTDKFDVVYNDRCLNRFDLSTVLCNDNADRPPPPSNDPLWLPQQARRRDECLSIV